MELRGNFIATLWGIWLHMNEIVCKGGISNPMRIMEIYRKNKASHIKATRKWGSGKKREQTTQATGEEWRTGQPNQQVTQIIYTDGSWKAKLKKNGWKAAIAWTMQDGSATNNHNERIFAISPLQT